MWQLVPATMYSEAMRKLAGMLFGELNMISCSIFHTWLTEQTPPSLLHKYITACSCRQCRCLHTQKSFLLYADFYLHEWSKMHLGMEADMWVNISSAETVRGLKPQLGRLFCFFFLLQPILMRYNTRLFYLFHFQMLCVATRQTTY